MNKSPISLLQELSVKNGYVPIYNFLETKSNELQSQFACQLFCNKFSCDGIGNSKKEAKHNAATKMLLYLEQICEPSLLSSNNSLSSPVNKIQNSDCINYVGLLQEYCVKYKLTSQDISYKVVDESGPCNCNSFTIEVSVGSLREQGTGLCKKSAKQEAAKKLLQNINPDITNLMREIKSEGCQEILEDNIRKLGIEISECNKSTAWIRELSKKTQLLYLEHTNKAHETTKQNFLIKDSHSLFEKNYSSKITFNMRQKMIVIRDTYINRKYLIEEVRQDIETILGIKLKRIIIPSIKDDYIVCLRLFSYPTITQLGIGKTKAEAETVAMYNIIITILTFLNIF